MADETGHLRWAELKSFVADLHQGYAAQDSVEAAGTARILKQVLYKMEELEVPTFEELKKKYLGDSAQ